MKVSIHKRKPNKHGLITMYMEIYKGYTKNQEGKIKHNREYIKLDTYLYHKPKTTTQKQQNKEMLKIAEAVKAKLTIELKNNTHGFENSDKGKTSLVDYFEFLTAQKKETDSLNNHKLWIASLNHLKGYCKNRKIRLNQVNEAFVSGFIQYLLHDVKTKRNTNLSKNSAGAYYKKFKACMNQAQRSRLIAFNPCKNVKGIKEVQVKRQYLTHDELLVLAQTDCKYPVLKQAFLFGCFTGLRISDIKQLSWEQVKDSKEGSRIVFRQQKTKGLEYQDLNPQARTILGDRSNDDNLIFPNVQNESYYNKFLQKWVDAANINKKITFHCSRHTFAMLLVYYKTDFMVIQKLLGHKRLDTTLVYAKILDEQKKEAVNRIPNINL